MDLDNARIEQPIQLLKPKTPGEKLKIAEVVLRKRNRDIEKQAERAQKRIDLKKEAARQNLDLGVVTPEKLIKNALVRQLDAKRVARLQRQDSCHPRVKYQERLASIFVVRNARTPTSKGSQAILTSMGIEKRYTATFVPNTSSEILRLRTIQPFIFYGFKCKENEIMTHSDDPDSADTKSTTNIDNDDQNKNDIKHNSIPVNDNVKVEERFGHLGILCIEDIIHVVKTGNSKFQEVMEEINAFQLGDILKAEGVDANIIESGNIGFKINGKVSKLM